MNAIHEHPEIRAALAFLAARLEGERQEEKIPAMSAAVVYDQQLLWAEGFGYADLEQEIPATPGTVYRIGSITKLFTATMLMQLRDAGKLQLDDPLENYLPGFHVTSPFPDARPVTFRQVASHTAGLPREAPLDYWRTLEFPPIEEIVESLKDAEMIFPTLTQFKYSNLGISLMGHALARIAGQPYRAYIRDHILEPLSMRHTGFDLEDPEIQARLAVGYTIYKDNPPEVAPLPDIGGFAPAGQMHATVEDMAHFISLQFREGPAQGEQILGGSTLREMHAPVFITPDWQGGMAIGWALDRVADHTLIGHGGGIHGFTTHIALVPALKLGVAVFTNTGTDPGRFTRAALELLIPVVTRIRAREEAAQAQPAPKEWKKYTGLYVVVGLAQEIEIKLADDKLTLNTPDGDPETRAILKPEGEHQFRMQGGPVDGELARFELDDAGQVTGVKLGNYVLERAPSQ
jgi:CubicO group peptidase (beta-lactamase class C family)